jgi:hypothetical protein
VPIATKRISTTRVIRIVRPMRRFFGLAVVTAARVHARGAVCS